VSSWNINNVINMYNMFFKATSFNDTFIYSINGAIIEDTILSRILLELRIHNVTKL